MNENKENISKQNLTKSIVFKVLETMGLLFALIYMTKSLLEDFGLL